MLTERPQVEDLSDYHRNILREIAGPGALPSLIATEDGYFIRTFCGYDGPKEVYNFRRVRAATITKLLKMSCIDFNDAADESNKYMHTTYSKEDFYIYDEG
jgi:hypothetical protein